MKRDALKLLRVLLLTMTFPLIVPLTIHAQAGKTNFSGTWILNAEESVLPQGGGGFGGGQRAGGGEFTIAQDASTLTQSRTGRDGTIRETIYILDGKENVNSTGRGETKYTAIWSADGNSLTITTKTSFNGNERTSTAVWSLKNEKTLSIETTREGQSGEVKTTMIYNQK
jgi:hypothetical protein